ncbi:MAG TPA: hypothetical protein VKB52_16630 [Rhodanobacteraceae bacterium]|nr:hypothetical protein [Rhodanobacteraceae bacterium]
MPRLRSLLLALVLLPLAAGAHSLGEPRIRGGLVSTPVAFGDFVYVASGVSIAIWNIADAAHPARIPFEPDERPPGPIFGLVTVGQFLYVGWANDARTDAGFQIYSLGDPAHPTRVGDAETQHADALLANGNYLYEVDGQFGVTSIDASDPLHPVVAGTGAGAILLPQSINSAEIANGYLYISGSSMIETCWGVIFDLADPAHPTSVGSMGLGAFGAIGAVSASGYAVAFGDAGGIYDVRDPAHVELVGTLPPSGIVEIDGALGTAFRGDDLYLFGGDVLPVYDLSMPTEPVQIAQASLDTNNLSMLTPLASGFLATTLTARGLLIDASTPSAPAIRGEIAMPSPLAIADVALDDRNVYMIGQGHALQVVDAASLDDVGILDAPQDDEGFALGYSRSVGVSGSTAIIGGYLTLFAVDVADPANPHVVGSLPLNFFDAVLVAGDRVYVPTNDGALTIVDIADPTAPALRGALPGLHYTPLAAAGSLVFTYGTSLSYSQGVYIADASDADHPVIAASYAPCVGGVFGNSFQTLAVTSDAATLAVACSDGSVEIVDVRDPSAPALAATYRPTDPADAARSIAAYGTTFYLGHLRGIDEVDASDPAAPTFVTRHPTASWVQAMRIAPDGSLLALTNAGMYVFECVASGGTRVLPCRDGTTPARIPLSHSAHARSR